MASEDRRTTWEPKNWGNNNYIPEKERLCSACHKPMILTEKEKEDEKILGIRFSVCRKCHQDDIIDQRRMLGDCSHVYLISG